MRDKPVAKPAPTQVNIQNIYRHPRLEWDSKHTIPVFERAKRFQAFECAAIVTGSFSSTEDEICGRNTPPH
jgi:hypothetical protein